MSDDFDAYLGLDQQCIRVLQDLDIALSVNDPSKLVDGCGCDPSVGHICECCFVQKALGDSKRTIERLRTELDDLLGDCDDEGEPMSDEEIDRCVRFVQTKDAERLADELKRQRQRIETLESELLSARKRLDVKCEHPNVYTCCKLWSEDITQSQIASVDPKLAEEFPFGCDTAEHLATALVAARQKVETLETQVNGLNVVVGIRDDHIAWQKKRIETLEGERNDARRRRDGDGIESTETILERERESSRLVVSRLQKRIETLESECTRLRNVEEALLASSADDADRIETLESALKQYADHKFWERESIWFDQWCQLGDGWNIAEEALKAR